MRAATAAAGVAAAIAVAPALAADHGFPGTNPAESLRLHTPNDRDYDRCELDDPDGQDCGNLFDEQFQRFGFAPVATQDSAVYKNISDPHIARLMAQNTLAGRHPLGQVSGVSVDRAWKYTAGDPRVKVAIIDTGITWHNRQLRLRVALNREELPRPKHSNGTDCAADDCDSSGAFNVDDFAQDPRVAATAGNDLADGLLDASDLIAEFSDSQDDDGNGYTDDIAGWDFLNDDNDAFDASSYSSAEHHGDGQAEEAVGEGNDGGVNGDGGDIGICPRCQFVPLRDWDSFVPDTNYFAEAVGYAADNGIRVVEGAIGGMFNTRFAQQAFDYAYRRGVFLAIVSSDINSANHNIPTVYDESLFVAGSVADNEGLGSNFTAEPAFYDFFGSVGITFPQNLPVGTYFRNSGLTQYGGHAHIVMPAVSGSIATGQASGAAALIASHGLKKGLTLQPNEIKQLLTGTAEDVVAENTTGTGVPDPAQTGWDQHFGYGRPDLGLALERVDQQKIPPQVLIKSPDWFAPLNVLRQSRVEIGARLSAPRAAGYTWRLQWAPGIEPCESDFRQVATGSGTAPRQGALGSIDLAEVRAALDARETSTPCGSTAGPVTGGSTSDPTAPGKGPGDVDPNEPAFTVRVVVTDSANNRAEDRKTLFAYRDSTAHAGWSKRLGTGGEASPRMFDVDGDNKLETVIADSSGALNVFRADGSPLPSWNGGTGALTRPYANSDHDSPVYGVLARPREVLRTPAIGDIDGDGEAEIVATAGRHAYAWHLDGSTVEGFPVSQDPSFSAEAVQGPRNHPKPGFMGAPTLADLDSDGDLEVVAAGMDQHLYAWRGDGSAPPGFPLLLKKKGETFAQVAGAESINTAAAGDLTGDGKPDVVVATNETTDSGEGPGGGIPNLDGAAGRVYAVDGKGQFLPGWPMEPSALLPNLLPFVGPGENHTLGDVDGDGKLDVIGNIATGQLHAFHADGSSFVDYDQQPQSGEAVDKSFVANAFDYPVLGDIDSAGDGPEVIKAGLTLQGAANLLLVGQNLPYNHLLQAWNRTTGTELPAYPQAIEDFHLLSEPAVADVSGAPGAEVVAGTGLYLLRAINGLGQEGTGFPKFTGGWLQATAAFGDTDGDGKLEIADLTREGHAFMWDTDRPACGTNDEWWGANHDERSSRNYETDGRPPGTPGGLLATKTGGRIVLKWFAPGDDWLCRDAHRFRILGSNGTLDHPRQGTNVLGGQPAAKLRQSETRTVDDVAGRRRLAVQYLDEAGNWGHLAGVAVPRREGETTCSKLGGSFGAIGVGPGEGGGSRPKVSLRAPSYSTRNSRSRAFTVRWKGQAPCGLDRFLLQVRTGGGEWRTLVRNSLKMSALFRGKPGRTYDFRLRAIGRDGQASRYAARRTVVPIDDRAGRLAYSEGWKRARADTAYRGTLARAEERGAAVRFRFHGTRLAVIAHRYRNGGRLRVTIDGRGRTAYAKGGRSSARRVVFRSKPLARRTHRVMVRYTGRGRLALDAIGITR